MKELHPGGFLIAKIHHVAGRIFARMLREHGIDLTPSQGRIMFVLWHTDGVPIRELGTRTALKKSTLTSLLDGLERAGYVIRVHSAKDRREVLIQRTEKDRAYIERYAKVSAEMSAVFYRAFSNEEIQAFESYLYRILANLTETPTQGGV